MKNEWLFKHGHRPKSGSSPTYTSWLSMKARCLNVDNKNYAGKNITVCDRWLDFNNFLLDMGDRPAKKTLERIDFSGNYEPSNCKWANSKEQSRNKRTNIFAEINGIKKCLKDWADEFLIPTTTIYRRFHEGLRGQDLLKTPRFKKPSCKKNLIEHYDA